MPPNYKITPLSFSRAKALVSNEGVDESWALELINECQQEALVRDEHILIEDIRLENVAPPETAPGPTAIDMQKRYLNDKIDQAALQKKISSREKPTLKSLLKRLISA